MPYEEIDRCVSGVRYQIPRVEYQISNLPVSTSGTGPQALPLSMRNGSGPVVC